MECLTITPLNLFTFKSFVNNFCMCQSYIPLNFKTGIIVREPKSKVEIKMSGEQFRPITIVPILLRVFQCCVI